MIGQAASADTILELGSCAGIGSSYLASTGCRRFVGIEGSEALAAIARKNGAPAVPVGDVSA